MSISLTKIPTDALVAELQRRLNCGEKKQRRTIFIGKSFLMATVYSS